MFFTSAVVQGGPCTVTAFKTIRARAEKRKGGPKALAKLLLPRRGSRLGGNTGQMMLRFLGWDGFVTSRDVVLCLRDAGLDIAETVTSKRDLAKVQAQFNAWAEETGLSYVQISRICAMSIGENYTAETLAAMVGDD